MFIYAFATNCAAQSRRKPYLDFSTAFRNDPFCRKYELEIFKIKCFRNDAPLLYRICALAAKLYKNKYPAFLKKLGFFLEKDNCSHFDENLIQQAQACKAKAIYLHGYWQNERYFKNIKNQIKKTFFFDFPKKKWLLERHKEVLGRNAVCLHLRRNHNLTHSGHRKPLPVGVEGSLPVEYYKKCIEILRKKISNPLFLCFSDCPSESRAILGSEKNLIFFHDYKEQQEPDFFEMFVMTQCKHFILANSTFSWWGAWLAENQAKLVLCPDHKKYLSCAAPCPDWIEVKN